MRNYVVTNYLDESWASGKNWKVHTEKVQIDPGNWDEITVIQTPERTLRQKKSFRKVTEFETVTAVTEYYIKTPEDFRQFQKYQPDLPNYDCSELSYARELVGEDGLSGTWLEGVFNMVGMHRDLGELLVDPYEDEEFFLEMMEYFLARLVRLVPQLVDAGCDFLTVAGNMASGSMAGPTMFREYIMPFEERLIEAIHKAGAKCIYHNCGDAKYLLPIYGEMSMDMYESLTAAPYGDTELEEAFAQIAPPKVLSGNLDQISFLKTATPEEVTNKVREVLTAAKKRGSFILAASDYLSEGTPEENIYAFAEAAKKYGMYE